MRFIKRMKDLFVLSVMWRTHTITLSSKILALVFRRMNLTKYSNGFTEWRLHNRATKGEVTLDYPL